MDLGNPSKPRAAGKWASLPNSDGFDVTEVSPGLVLTSTRVILHVDKAGKIHQVGYFMPATGSTIATYWITDKIVYALDINRGIDILRFTP